MNCLVCNGKLIEIFDFGDMPIANNFSKSLHREDEYRYQLVLAICNSCKMVQTLEQPAADKMFHSEYAFHSSTSSHMRFHFEKLAEQLISEFALVQGSRVLEIGCNDGIFLEHFCRAGISAFGFEPSSNVAEIAKTKGAVVIDKFFSSREAENFNEYHGLVDLVYSANVICHIPSFVDLLVGVKKLIGENGVFVFEDPYWGAVFEKYSFDQIYDEHVFLFSATSVKHASESVGLELIAVEEIASHGGSMRYTIGLKGCHKVAAGVGAHLAKESDAKIFDTVELRKWASRVKFNCDELVELLRRCKLEGKRVVGYGATSKSTTVIQYCGITPELLPCIYDTSPSKANTYSPANNIPVKPYSEFREDAPDLVLLFAWNHLKEIEQKETDFMGNERKWIKYVPMVRID